MRVCGVFSALDDVARAEEGVQPDRFARERVGAALLAVDHADRGAAPKTGLAYRVDCVDRRPARGDDVLHETDLLVRGKVALKPVLGAVALRLLANEEAAANATAPSSGPAIRVAPGAISETRPAIRSPSAPRMSGRVSKRYLSR
jgi:hypothetical protein